MGFSIDYLFSFEYLLKILVIDYCPNLEMAMFELLKFIYHFVNQAKMKAQVMNKKWSHICLSIA